ncbi:HNH endonuclease signature motif containing protein [Pseudarthrobacter sp. AB1]|uniref:HNH endonuclease signature motif containing protein n=1 Tax=Pseudarthrobacter sp. AB1 TaxID=2138309 RepID=UPI00186B82FC|nr:HNH endonuclease signature motif containing protein [Pseudarthrobacter sp. AB1]MBE4718387.1 endonuclease [Pseudarthrobacter sp. AB1]
MDSRGAVVTAEALSVSFAELAARLRGGADREGSGADPLRRAADDFLDGLAAISRLDAKSAALKVWLAAGYSAAAVALAGPAESPQDHRGQEMAVVAEVACAMTVSERSAGALLGEAHVLTTDLPLTFSALQAGTILWQHARIMVEETMNLDPAGAQALEAHFLDPEVVNPARGPAGELIPGRFRHKARTWRERHHPVSIEKRHARGLQDRRVEYAPDRDGMAWLSAYLPADQAAGIWDRTTAAARALQGPDESRTLTQLRADTVATWLLDRIGDSAGAVEGNGGVPSPRAQVLITVPVFSLLGLTDEPAMLNGYGPIPPSMARQLVADGADSFHRVLTDPRDGAPLEIGRSSYRVTKAQRQWLRLRDGKCPFPGCSNHSLDNEADHLLAWAHGGTTGISNLSQPCHKHHRLRHITGWTPTPATKNEPPGWTSPTGRHYTSEHPDWEPPAWPSGMLEVPGHQEPDCPPSEDALPKGILPSHALSSSTLPGCQHPANPSPGWAELWSVLEEPQPSLSVADFLWFTAQPLRNGAAP